MTFIGKRVKERREELGISQTVLAKRIGVSGPSLSQLESGKIKRSRRMAKLASVLKVTPEWLEGTSDEKPPVPPATIKANGAARPRRASKAKDGVKANGSAKSDAVPARVMRLAQSLLPLPANKLRALFVLADIR